MTRKYRKRSLLYFIIAVVFIIVGGFYLNAQLKVRSTYMSLKEGETAYALTAPLTADSEFTRYSYTFMHGGTSYAGTTLLSYTKEGMSNLCGNTGGLLPVKYLVKDGEVVLSTEEKTKEGLPIAQSFEENYFSNSAMPSLTMSIVFFCIGGALLLVVLISTLQILYIKSIDRNGKFAYGIFMEAYSSRFGSKRYLAVRYSYMNEFDEWVEAVTPYTFSANTVEMFKTLKTIEVKYKGKASIITETFSSRTMN